MTFFMLATMNSPVYKAYLNGVIYSKILVKLTPSSKFTILAI